MKCKVSETVPEGVVLDGIEIDQKSLSFLEPIDSSLSSLIDMEETIMTESSEIDTKDLLDAFKSSGGWYDQISFSLKPFQGMGYGGVALLDIQVSIAVSSILLIRSCRQTQD